MLSVIINRDAESCDQRKVVGDETFVVDAVHRCTVRLNEDRIGKRDEPQAVCPVFVRMITRNRIPVQEIAAERVAAGDMGGTPEQCLGGDEPQEFIRVRSGADGAEVLIVINR